MTTPEAERLEKLIQKVWDSKAAAESLSDLYCGETTNTTGHYAARYQGQAKAFEQVLTELRAFQGFCNTGNWGNK